MEFFSKYPLWLIVSTVLILIVPTVLAVLRKIKKRDATRYIIFSLIAVYLLYWAYKDVNYNDLFEQLKHTNWWWIAAALGIEYVSVIFRGFRWNQLLEPLNHKAKDWNAIHAVAFGYCMNDLVPRSGEVARCTLLYKSDNIPVHTLIGTVITERIIDMVMFGVLLLVGFLLLPSTISSLFDSTKSIDISAGIIIFLVVFMVIGIVLLRYILKHNFKNPFLEKFAQFVRGTWAALISVRKVKGFGKFIGYTFGIWLAWLAMTWFNLLAIPGCDHMGINESVFLMICASLAMLAPTPGGLGAFHSMTVLGFIVLGYADPGSSDTSLLGLTFATISWATRTFMEIATGFVGFLIVSYRIKKSTHASAHS
jgi:uncharacterized protein (TIRG00374 family)